MSPYLAYLPSVVVIIVGGGLTLYLRSYFMKKGENLATKSDIAGITREIEGVKSEFAKGITRLSHDYGLFAKTRNEAYGRIAGHLRTAIEAAERCDGGVKVPDLTIAKNWELKAIVESQYFSPREKADWWRLVEENPTMARVDADDMYRIRQQRRTKHAQEQLTKAIQAHSLYLSSEVRGMAATTSRQADVIAYLMPDLHLHGTGSQGQLNTAIADLKTFGTRLEDRMRDEIQPS